MEIVAQGHKLLLDTDEKVFTPSPHGTKGLAGALQINLNESVIDLGTGTGFLAILASKLGGQVVATDILKESVSLANKNALKNKTKVEVKLGDLFEPYKNQTYDVIIANIPQEVLSPKLLKTKNRQFIIGYHGGADGGELLMKVLKRAPQYMHASSRLYVVVYGMSNYSKSLSYIVSNYNAKLLNFLKGPVKNFVYEDLEWYKDLETKGDIIFYKVGEEYWSDLFVFELRLK